MGLGASQRGASGSGAQAPASFLSRRDRARCLSQWGPVRTKSATGRRAERPECTRLAFPGCSPERLVESALTVGPRSGLVFSEGGRSPGPEPGTLLPAPPGPRGHCATPACVTVPCMRLRGGRCLAGLHISCRVPALRPGAAWLLGLTGREQRRWGCHRAPHPPLRQPHPASRGGERLRGLGRAVKARPPQPRP